MVAGFYTRSDKVGDRVRAKVRSCSIHHGKLSKLQRQAGRLPYS
jgi:hypothetical protein